jgi:hypothetical protein
MVVEASMVEMATVTANANEKQGKTKINALIWMNKGRN